MTTAMSAALAEAGLVSKEKAGAIETTPFHLRPYKVGFDEIQTLLQRLEVSGRRPSPETSLVVMLFQFELASGKTLEAVTLMLEHLRQEVAKIN